MTPSSPPAAAPSARHSGSHHRRQSSVSSRRESHEMMGINSLPFDQDDNPTTGDQRQRALWALEGRNPSLSSSPAQSPVNFSFGTVAIPDWKTPDVERDDYACEFLPPDTLALTLTPVVCFPTKGPHPPLLANPSSPPSHPHSRARGTASGRTSWAVDPLSKPSCTPCSRRTRTTRRRPRRRFRHPKKPCMATRPLLPLSVYPLRQRQRYPLPLANRARLPSVSVH